MVPSNDSSTLVTCVGGHGNSRGDGRGDGVPDGRRGDGCDLPRRYSYRGMNDHTEYYCWDKWGKRENAHQEYDENIQLTTSAPGHNVFNSTPASASDTSSPLEQVLQKLDALTNTSSQPTTIMTHKGNPTFVTTQSSSSSWVIDSGVSSHMSGINSLFHNQGPIKHNIVLIDGSTHPVLGKDVVQPTQSFVLFDSLYMLNFPFNLLSMSQLTKSLKCSVIFSLNFCVFRTSG